MLRSDRYLAGLHMEGADPLSITEDGVEAHTARPAHAAQSWKEER